MNLLESATLENGIYLFDDCTLISLADGHSVMVVDAREFERVQDWVLSTPATGILSRDIKRFVGLFSARVTRPGCHLATQGRDEDLLRIARGMAAVGMDVTAWHLPRVIKLVMRRQRPVAMPAMRSLAA